MKKLYFLPIMASVFIGCKSKEATPEQDFSYEDEKLTPVQQGQKLFEGRGNCTACHQPEQKIIGPSLKEISAIYKDKKGSIVNFLREKDGPIVDPSQYEAMKINFAVTDRMTEDELKALETYILSH